MVGSQQITLFIKIMHELIDIPVVFNGGLKQWLIFSSSILARSASDIYSIYLPDGWAQSCTHVPEKQKKQKMIFIQKSNIVFCKII
jgi:hypothetical protein